MRQALSGGGALDRPADQRRGRTGVLMVGMPGAARERACAIDALAEIDVSRIQGRGSRVKAAGARPRPASGFALHARRAQDEGFGSNAS
jgi:hypothetical protein